MAVLHNAAEQIPDRLATRPPVRETVGPRPTMQSLLLEFRKLPRIEGVEGRLKLSTVGSYVL